MDLCPLIIFHVKRNTLSIWHITKYAMNNLSQGILYTRGSRRVFFHKYIVLPEKLKGKNLYLLSSFLPIIAREVSVI